MSTTSKIFKTSAIVSTALLSLLGACAIDDPIDYTTDGYTAGPQGGGSGDGGNTGSSYDFVEWTRQLGTSNYDVANGIATDSSGNVYVTGNTWVYENGYPLTLNSFVVKYDSSGAKQWTQQLGTSNDDYAEGIATDSSGNVYVTGETVGALDNNTNAGAYDLFVVKYDSSGAKQWTQQLGTSNGDEANGIATDSSGNVYVTGFTGGALDNNTSAGASDLFVVKYDSAGDHKWTKQLGTSSYDQARGITTDSSGNIYLTGGTYDSIDFLGSHREDLFVVKYDSDGDWKWTRQVDDAGFGVDIIANSNGDIYVASSNGNATLMKYDSDGNKLWTKQLDSDGPLWANGLTMDDNGNIYITGSAHSEICNGLPGHDEDYEACLDAFVVKYDSEGDWKWTQKIGTSSYDAGDGITTDSSGNVYLTGVTSGNLDGNTNAGEYDLFVMKLK
jgi:hypothetical protein